jgi:hypothetical protein
MNDVTIVDSGVANLASVRAAFDRLGATVTVSSDANVVRNAARLVVPGVGAFGAGVESLRSKGLDVAIVGAIESRKPVLAICLGMQVLAEWSDESPGVRGPATPATLAHWRGSGLARTGPARLARSPDSPVSRRSRRPRGEGSAVHEPARRGRPRGTGCSL